jgi:hypothetical protein
VSLPAPPAAGAAESALLLRVRDYSGTDPAVLAEAHAIVASILADPGIHLLWRDKPPNETPDPADCLAVDVHLMGPRSTRLSTDDGTFGLAIVGGGEDGRGGGGRTAFVFSDRVLAFARRHRLDAGRLLGQVIAHEVGHLLLASKAHAAAGLMRGLWTPGFLRKGADHHLRFSASEAAAIRRQMLTPATAIARR